MPLNVNGFRLSNPLLIAAMEDLEALHHGVERGAKIWRFLHDPEALAEGLEQKARLDAWAELDRKDKEEMAALVE